MKPQPQIVLQTGRPRYCAECQKHIATLGGKFVDHGNVSNNGRYKACTNSGKRPMRFLEGAEK